MLRVRGRAAAQAIDMSIRNAVRLQPALFQSLKQPGIVGRHVERRILPLHVEDGYAGISLLQFIDVAPDAGALAAASSPVMGAETQLVDEGFDIGIRESWLRALEDVKAKGGKPYAIPAGASVHKFGGLGYVGFAEEVRAQEREMGLRFDYVIVCTVTGSTHAGMVVGFAADGRERNVIGIDASCTPAQTKAQVLDIAQKTSDLVGGRPITADDIVLKEEYAYPVYGVPSKETVEAIRLSARLEGMITDPVYEGKSMQGMIDLVQKGFFPKGSKVLYAHLGGAPALNGYSYTFRNG